MAKQSGLGDRLYIHGRDFSGDIGALGTIGGPRATIEVTGIDKSAHERILGKGDIKFDYDGFFNDDTGQAHAYLKTLPTTDVIMSYLRGTALGSPTALAVVKQLGYDLTRGADGGLNFKVAAEGSAGLPLIWMNQYTAGKQTHASATNGTSIDLGLVGSAIAVTSSSAANPSVITCTGHGFTTGDNVTIAGHSGSTPSINGTHVVTVTGVNTFTIPVNVSVGGTGGTAQLASRRFGATAVLQVFSLGSGTVMGRFEDSADNSSFAAITGLTFAGVGTGAVPASEVLSTATGAVIRRYVRFASTGTFTNALLFAALERHEAQAIF